jgi:hypothetical protein
MQGVKALRALPTCRKTTHKKYSRRVIAVRQKTDLNADPTMARPCSRIPLVTKSTLKDWFWTMINQLQNKEVMMGPDSIKMAMRHEIQDRWILYESKWIYEIDRLGWNILEESLTYRKIVYDKVQRVEYDKIRSSVAMLIVYVDYSSNRYIFLLWDMLVGWKNTLLNRSVY